MEFIIRTSSGWLVFRDSGKDVYDVEYRTGVPTDGENSERLAAFVVAKEDIKRLAKAS